MAVFKPRTSKPASNSKYYSTNINPWIKKGIGSCTMYAQGRIEECEDLCFGTTKKQYKDTWYPIDMYNKCSEIGAKKVKDPVLGGGVVWNSKSLPTGHIAIVESIKDGVITFSQYDSKNNFSTGTAKKSEGWNWNGYDLIGFFDCGFKWDSAQHTNDYANNTIENRFKVKVNGTQVGAYTNYSNAVKKADSVGGVIIDGSTGKQIYSAAKPSLTARSYPNYTDGKSFYRVRKSWSDPKSQIGAYSVWENAYNSYKKAGEGYHIFNNKGEQLD